MGFESLALQLDAAPQAAQAASLPLIFGALLAGAYAVNVLGAGTQPPPEQSQAMLTDEVIAAARSAVTAVQPLSTASVCLFAVNAEMQASARALGAEGGAVATSSAEAESPSALSLAAAAAALACVASAYLGFYPTQNVVNACVAIGVARVLQLPSLGAILAALTGLALYDAAGTLFTAATAAGPPSELVPPSSVMESVAQAKVSAAAGGGGVWQPGLLTVQLQGRLTDGLGLGDVVAPSILAGWCRRLDVRRGGRGDGGGRSYLSVALGGYAIGCVLLEVVPAELSRAALLFLVPSTCAAVLIRLAEREELAPAFGLGAERETSQQDESGY